MIRREEEIRIRKVEGAMGGKGTVIFHDWLLPEEAPGHGRIFSKVIIPSGCSIGYHQHNGEYEGYYILSGEGVLTDNGEKIILKPGDMNLCKDGSYHGIENVSEEDLVMMATVLNTL